MDPERASRGQTCVCTICQKTLEGKTELIGHLRVDHEVLEVASYAAATMAAEQDRDAMFLEYHRRFGLLKDQLSRHQDS